MVVRVVFAWFCLVRCYPTEGFVTLRAHDIVLERKVIVMCASYGGIAWSDVIMDGYFVSGISIMVVCPCWQWLNSSTDTRPSNIAFHWLVFCPLFQHSRLHRLDCVPFSRAFLWSSRLPSALPTTRFRFSLERRYWGLPR